MKKIKRPIASFVQLGLESKLLSLDIVEKLRLAKIPLQLSLGQGPPRRASLTVEKYHTPYVIVIGKKEAMDKTAIVRRVDTYSQETVPLCRPSGLHEESRETVLGEVKEKGRSYDRPLLDLI